MSRQTHCRHGHEFTPDNVYQPPGRTERQCRTCIRIRVATPVELTCPDCDETRTVMKGTVERRNKKYPAEVCQPCATRRAHPGPKPTPHLTRVKCPDCGGSRDLLERQARRIRSGEHSGLCGKCQTLGRNTEEPAEDYHEFWRSRFTQKQIDQLWAALSMTLNLDEEMAA